MAMRSPRKKEQRRSLVPPVVAGIASLIVPGLGQMLALEIVRGLLLLGSVASIAGMLVWRVRTLAPRAEGLFGILGRAFERDPFFVGLMAVGLVGLWLWSALDAYRQAQPGRRGGAGIFVLVLVLFFILGWQIGEIDIYQLIAETPEGLPFLTQVLWPWEAAFEREVDVVSARAPILVPCPEEGEEVEVPEQAAPGPDEPSLLAEPDCGQLSELDEQNQVVPGTTLTLVGRNFRPDTLTQIWWIDPLGNEFRIRQAGEYVTVQTDAEGNFQIDIIMPYRLLPSDVRDPQSHSVQARQTSEVGPLRASEPLRLILGRMVETIVLGMMATLFGIVFSIPVSFLAARNLMSGSWITVGIYYLTRGILNIVRSIEPLIWAIIAIIVVGLGPFAGIIALTVHSVAALGKLYSEAIESIDPGPVEAVQATGATRLQTIMYAVIPQMIPPFVSFSIYRWDINVRLSTVIGLVGGGGIGFLLVQYIRLLDYRAAGIAVWFIAITVAILDYVSAEIRERFV